MRDGQHSLVADQLLDLVALGRFFAPDVDAGIGHFAAFQSFKQGRLVDNAAAGGVEDRDAILHCRQLLGADQIAGTIGKGYVYGDDIGGLDQFVQSDQTHAEVLGALLRDIGVGANDIAAKGLEAGGDAAANFAQADNPGDFALQFASLERAAIPRARLETGVGGNQFAAAGEDQRHGVLDNAVDVAEGGVANDNASLAGGFDIDVVEADAGAGDDFKLLAGFKQFTVSLGGAANDNAFVIADDGE